MDEKTFNKQIGANIKKLRKLHGYSQKDMALTLDISYQAWQSTERGTTKTSFYRICQIMSMFKDVTFEDIVSGASTSVSSPLNEKDHERLYQLASKAAELCETSEGRKILRSIEYLIK